MIPGNVDRRPWLIISAAEAQALLDVALAEARPSANLRRAIRVVENQLGWLRDGSGAKPSIGAAVERDEAALQQPISPGADDRPPGPGRRAHP